MLQLTHTIEDVRRVVRVFVLSCTVAAGWGLYGFIALDLERAAGPIADPNDFAYLMVCALPLACYLLAEETRRRAAVGRVLRAADRRDAGDAVARRAGRPRRARAVGGAHAPHPARAACCSGIAALLSVAALAFALWAPLLNDRLSMKGRIADKNVAAREALWSGAVRMAADRPLTGVGPGRFGIESAGLRPQQPGPARREPVVAQLLPARAGRDSACSGLIGVRRLPRLVLAPARARREDARSASDDRDGRRLATAMQASLLVAIVAGAFLSEQLTTPFWLIGALATVVAGVPQAVARAHAAVARRAAARRRRGMKVGLVSTLARGGPVEHTVTLAGGLSRARRRGARGVRDAGGRGAARGGGGRARR